MPSPIGGAVAYPNAQVNLGITTVGSCGTPVRWLEIGRPEPCLLIVVQLTIVPRSENFRSFVNILAELRISCGKTQSIIAVVPAVFVPVAYNDLPNVVVGGVSIPLASSIDRNRVLLCSLYASSVPQKRVRRPTSLRGGSVGSQLHIVAARLFVVLKGPKDTF